MRKMLTLKTGLYEKGLACFFCYDISILVTYQS